MSAISAPKTTNTSVRDEVLDGRGISLTRVAAILPRGRGGARPNPATIWRWVVQGIKLPGGGRLYLEAVRMSGRWVTSKKALARFLDAQTPALGEGTLPAPRSPAARRAESERAEKELRKSGA
jgi:hypothetical protein